MDLTPAIVLGVLMKYRDFQSLTPDERHRRLLAITRVFFKLGCLSFGGPAAHVAYMDHEIVKKRGWLTQDKFIDLLGATNLIPGPNATEMAIHIGYEHGSVPGLLLAGLSFIIPAMLICLVFGFVYVRFGTLPDVSMILYGIKPVMMAIIVQALYRLGQNLLKTWLAGLLVLGVVSIYLLTHISELLLMAGCGLLLLVIRSLRHPNQPRPPRQVRLHAITPLPLLTIFLVFLKIGAVLYGSGYVLLAFLESELVRRYPVLTQTQLFDAIAVGQITPGPVFSTATFIGYLLHGPAGAILATIGIFLPSFIFVWLLNPLIPRMRASRWLSALLDGVNLASLGLMAAVSLRLAQVALTDCLTVALLAAALVLLLRTRINSVWLVLGGGLLGYLSSWLH